MTKRRTDDVIKSAARLILNIVQAVCDFSLICLNSIFIVMLE